MEYLPPKNKKLFLILSFFLLLHFYRIKKKINQINTFFITVNQQQLRSEFKFLSYYKKVFFLNYYNASNHL